MDVFKMLNEDTSPGPGRSRASVSQSRSELRRSVSNVPDLSSPSSQPTQSPMNNFRSLPDETLSRSASIHSHAKPSPKSVNTRLSTSPAPVAVPVAAAAASTHKLDAVSNNKRAAPNEVEPAAPHKRLKQRKYTERPIWARLSPRNARHTAGDGIGTNAVHSIHRAGLNGIKVSNGTPQVEARLSTREGALNDIDWNKPWLNPVPYDFDLLRPRKILGPWEKSMKYSTPYPDLLYQVSNWIVETLQSHKDIAQDPSRASLEVEAKIGTLVKASSGQPIDLPVLNMTLLSPSVQRDYRFESELQEADFVFLNQMLNATLLESRQPGRQAIQHSRRNERDSFTELSPAGLGSLPTALRASAMQGRELKLRTTRVESSGETTARIVKVPLSHRQIYNPHGYDCRISINVEVNFMQSDVQEMTLAPTLERAAPPDRKKERLSYTHLGAYSVDLTKVQVGKLVPKYELEVEVQSDIMLRQLDLMASGQQHAFSYVSNMINL